MGKLGQLGTLIERLRKRGGMYIQPFSYDGLVAYLSGYDHARVDAGEASELDEFSDWLQRKVGHHCSLHWSALVREEFARGDKDLAKEQLFDLLDEFRGLGNDARAKIVVERKQRVN